MSMTPRAKKPSPRWTMLNLFVDAGQRLVGAAAGRAWVTLFRFASEAGRVRRSQASLAALMNVSTRAVRDALAELRSAGLLQVDRHGGKFRGPNSYRLFGQPRQEEDNCRQWSGGSPPTHTEGNFLPAENGSGGRISPAYQKRQSRSPRDGERDSFDSTAYPDAADYMMGGAAGEPGTPTMRP